MRFEVVICENLSVVPHWCCGAALDVAVIAEGEGEMPVVVARRPDGDVQVIPHAAHDPEVIAGLLRWAAGADAQEVQQ